MLALVSSWAVASCAYAPPGKAPERKAPPRVIVVGLEELGLRTTAWVELHAWLATAARRPEQAAASEVADPELDVAARDYRRVLAQDDRDELLGRTAVALEACDDEACARAAVSGTGFATPYLYALPGFLTRHWLERAEIARTGIEAARTATSDEVMTPLVAKLAKDLAIDWPASPPRVDVVAEAPAPGPAAPIRVLLSTRSACFARERGETDRVHDARIVDCVLAYALVRMQERSALGIALGRELAARDRSSELSRAWTALVVHAVSTAVSGWEPRHASTLRRSAAVAMPAALEWLAEEWPARMRGASSVEAVARSYAGALAEHAEHQAGEDGNRITKVVPWTPSERTFSAP